RVVRLLGTNRKRLYLLCYLVPAGDDLPAGQKLLADGAAIKGAWNPGEVQGPLAHPGATEALNRHGESQAAASLGRAVSDETPAGHVQVQSLGVLGPTRDVAEDVSCVPRRVAHVVNAIEVPTGGAVGKERGVDCERAHSAKPRGRNVRHDGRPTAIDGSHHRHTSAVDKFHFPFDGQLRLFGFPAVPARLRLPNRALLNTLCQPRPESLEDRRSGVVRAQFRDNLAQGPAWPFWG